MALPAEHAALLRQQDFVVPASEQLGEGERALLRRYGRWLEALATGRLQPLTPEQERFVRVCRGADAPSTEFERAWVNYSRMQSEAAQPGPMELETSLARLAQARRCAAAVHTEYKERRAAVMELVREGLEALDEEFSDRMRDVDEEVGWLEFEVRSAVLKAGHSVKHAGIRAVYARGRVTWDNRGLGDYAETHPDVLAFRKVGAPSVSIRYSEPEKPG